MDQLTRATRPRPWLPWLIIAGALLVFGADFVFFDKVFLPMDVLQIWSPWKPTALPGSTAPLISTFVNADAAQSIYPLLDFISRSLQEGHVPLWNPHIFLGLPTTMIGAANFVFNPLYVALLWAFETATAHSLALLINLALIASFAYLLFLQRGLTRTASLAGSLALTFSGHLMAFLELALADFAFAGAVVSLYCYERSLAEPRMRFMLGNGIVLGLLLMGVSIQWVGFLVPLIGLYAVMRTAEQWTRGRPLRHNARGLTAYFAPLALGALLAAPTLLPLPEYVALSHRAATFYPERFATLLFPNFFGSQAPGHNFGTLSLGQSADRVAGQNYNELMVYMGVVTLPLVLLAYRVREYRWATAFWSVIILGALAVAMKPPLLYPFLYHYVPGFNGMQATRALILLPLPLATLAAIGMHGMQRDPLQPTHIARVWKGLFAVTATLVVALIGAQVYLTGHPIVAADVPLAQHFHIRNPDFAVPLVILGMVGLGYWLLARRIISVQALCNSLICLLLIDLLGLGLRLNTRVDRALVYPPAESLRYLTDDPEHARILPLNVPYNTLMPYGISVLGGYSSMYPSSYFALMSAMEAAESPQPPIASPLNRNYVWLVGYTSKLLPMLNVIDATLSRPALVVVSEQFFPGWNARLDGAPTALLKVNAALMGAMVPAGSHHLTLQFLPKSVMIGAIVSVATLSTIIALLLVDGARHRRRRVR